MFLYIAKSIFYLFIRFLLVLYSYIRFFGIIFFIIKGKDKIITIKGKSVLIKGKSRGINSRTSDFFEWEKAVVKSINKKAFVLEKPIYGNQQYFLFLKRIFFLILIREHYQLILSDYGIDSNRQYRQYNDGFRYIYMKDGFRYTYISEIFLLFKTNLHLHDDFDIEIKYYLPLVFEYFKNLDKVYKIILNWSEKNVLESSLGLAYLIREKTLFSQFPITHNKDIYVQFFQITLNYFSKEISPYQWATAQYILGNDYTQKIEGDKGDNIKQAINSYKASLEVYSYSRHPLEWARSQESLGYAYYYYYKVNRSATINVEKAIHAFLAALEVYNCGNHTHSRVRTLQYLGYAYFDLEKGDKVKNIRRGIHALETALKTSNLEKTMPETSFDIASYLGDFFSLCGFYKEVVRTLDIAIKAFEIMRNKLNSDRERQEFQQKEINVYDQMIEALLKECDIDGAIKISERFRSRMLVDITLGKSLSIGDLKAKREELFQKYQELQEAVDLERNKLSKKANPQSLLPNKDTLENDRVTIEELSEKILELEQEKQLVFQEIRKQDPVLAGTVQVDALEFQQIQQLISDSQTAIVSFYAIGEDTHVFIVYQDRESQHYICQQQETDLKTWIDKHWLQPYQVAFNTKKLKGAEKRRREEQRQNWIGSVSVVMEELSQRLNLNHLIEEYLQGIEELIIIPHGYLHNIPFAALPISDTEYLNDKFRIRHAPSCQILKFCQDRKPVANIAYGTVEDADGSLPGAKIEGQKVAQLFDIPEANRLIGKEQSTVTEYRQLAKRVQALHSSHHANSRLDNPLESTLKLANGSITLGELLLWRLDDLEEVFLSCCETNLGMTESTDDVLTLASGFLCAGARGVVSSLWVADDLSAILLSTFYYKLRKEGKSRSEALQQAQQKLRRLTGEELAELFQSDLKPYLDYRLDRFEQQLKDARKAYSKANEEFEKIKKLYPKSEECRYWHKEKTKQKRKANKYRDILNGFEKVLCQQSHPFANPYYWGVFICSGLA